MVQINEILLYFGKYFAKIKILINVIENKL
jgi:hypothetical protein